MMKIEVFMGALAEAVFRQACRACIERCHAIAGQFDRADALSAAFFDEAC